MFYFMTPEGAQITFIGLSLIYFLVAADLVAVLVADKEERTKAQKIYLWLYAGGCLIAAFAFSFSVAFTGENPVLDRDYYVKWSWLLWFLHLWLLGIPVVLGTYGIFSRTFKVSLKITVTNVKEEVVHE